MVFCGLRPSSWSASYSCPQKWSSFYGRKDPRADRDLFRFGAVSQRQGFINSLGEVVLRHGEGVPTIKGDFFEGLAKAWDTWYGYIDIRGNWVIPPKFMEAGDFSSGLAAVRVGQLWGYVDRQGALVVRPEFDEARDFHDGRAAVRKGDRFGYIDRSGNLIVPFRYSVARDFSHKRAWVVREPGLCWVTAAMDDQGLTRRRIGPGLGTTIDFLFQIPNCRYELISLDGKTIGDHMFDDVHDFSEGLAAVAFHNEFGAMWGYIDPSGDFAMPPQFKNATSFSEGLAAAVPYGTDQGTGWGYIDRAGNFVVKPGFILASRFSNGLAAVATRDAERMKYDRFYINRSGQQAFPAPYEVLSDFAHGLAVVLTKYGELPIYIDTSGKTVFSNSDHPK